MEMPRPKIPDRDACFGYQFDSKQSPKQHLSWDFEIRYVCTYKGIVKLQVLEGQHLGLVFRGEEKVGEMRDGEIYR